MTRHLTVDDVLGGRDANGKPPIADSGPVSALMPLQVDGAVSDETIRAAVDAAPKAKIIIGPKLEAELDAAISKAILGPSMHAFNRPADPVGGDKRAPRYFAVDDVMAIQPSALERMFVPSYFGDEEASKPYAVDDGVAVICIDGPLMQRALWWWDGYDAIQGRFECALEDDDVTAIVLKIASPGGVCSGCFSAVRAMLSAKAESGKPVYAYADESAFSAAYAIACVADEIYLPREGGVGSAGVIVALQDWSGFNEKMGIRVTVLTTGKYKADGNPNVPLKPDAIARFQARVDMLGDSFAEVVGTSRGMTSEAVMSLEAACCYGDDAITAGLANGIKTFDEVMTMARTKGLASMQTNNSPAYASASTRTHMSTTKNETMQVGELLSVSHAEFALAAGLPHDASKGDVLAAMSRTKSELDAVVSACGAKTTAEAIGKAAAMPAIVEDAAKAKNELATVRKEQESASVGGLIEKANAAGKFGESGTEKAFAFYAKHGKDALEAHLDALIPQAALSASKPAPKQPEGATKVPGAKTEIKVELTDLDRKHCEKYGVSEEAFIASRRKELQAKADREASERV